MITISTINLIMGIFGIFGVVFGVFLYFKNPQIKQDQISISFANEIGELKKQIIEIRETHLRNVENDMKSLTTSVNELAKTVIRLSTIIDERIPKGSPNLTPPGA